MNTEKIEKEYVIRISKKEGQSIFDLALVAGREIQMRGDIVPDKFIQAKLAVGCRFTDHGPCPVYKMNHKHLMGVLDSIGGYFSAAHLAVEKYNEPAYILEDAKKLMKIALKIERQAIKQGFQPEKRIEIIQKPYLQLVKNDDTIN